MGKILSELKERSLLLIIVLVVSFSFILIAYFIGGLNFALGVILPLVLGILTVSKSVWTSDTGQTKVALGSLGILLMLAFGSSINPGVFETLLEPLYNRIPILKGIIPPVPVSTPIIIILVIAIIWLNYLMRDNTAMNKHSTPLEKEFPEIGYEQKLLSFARVFKDDLDRIEREGNWSTAFFVPLEAEVEVRDKSKISKKKKDLLSVLKSEKKAKTFLVVGPPGSGKSVALRKLCRELLEEVDKTSKIPVYVNLKEWSSVNWTKENPPTRDEFHRFVLQNLKNQGDRFTDEFIDKYFDKMVESGRVFFIFDSFDEIPALLEQDSSWILDEISKILHKYINGAHESRGVVASRFYKSPTNKLSVNVNVEILPFSEEKVAEAIRKYPKISENSIQELLTRRRDLLPIAKNPFYCALVVNYLQDNNNQLPETRAALFKSYFERRLEDSNQKIAEKGLVKSDVEKICQQIGNLMLNSESHGFEYPIAKLESQINTFDKTFARKVIEVLVYSKIGRHSNNEKTLFTFSHRRFAEYFAVLSLLGKENTELLEDIPNDGKWRDVLVLLAELEEIDKSQSIALFTWDKLLLSFERAKERGGAISYPVIHCLRFLRDAYRSRKEGIAHLKGLETFVTYQLAYDSSILEKKIALECVGLLNEDSINLTLLEAFRQNNDWLSETALKSCFYLNKLDANLQKSLIVYIDSFSILHFLQRLKALHFLLSLSPLLKFQKRFLFIRLIDIFLILILYICHTFYNPIIAVIYLVAVLLSLDKPLEKIESFSIKDVLTLRLRFIWLPIVANLFAVVLNAVLYPFGYEIIQWRVPVWLFLFNLLMFFPWYQIYYYFVKYKDYEEIIFKIAQFRKEEFTSLNLNGPNHQPYILELNEKIAIADKILSILKPLLAFSVLILLLIIIVYIGSLISEGWSIYFFGFITLFLLVGYIWSLRENIYLFQDYRLSSKFINNNEFTREAISNHFYKLKTALGRLNFVNQLKNMGNSPSGEWEGKLPNVKNDKASIRLAQLEEVWRNLDR